MDFLHNNSDNDFEKKLTPALYIISTPIGNIQDISFRAIEYLKNLDVLYAEDPRITLRLLSFYQIKRPILIYNDQSGQYEREKIIAKLEAGQSVGLVSDAGTPLISDPGYKLVSQIIQAGLSIFSVPGCSSVMAAISLSGLPTDKFLFLGFPPRKKDEVKDLLNKYQNLGVSLIFFESANRIVKFLSWIQENLPNSRLCLAKELTKFYEEKFYGNPAEIITKLLEKTSLLKGELVLILYQEPELTANRFTESEVRFYLEKGLRYLPATKISKFLSEISGFSRKHIYKLALSFKHFDE